jgi:hypothetical protein
VAGKTVVGGGGKLKISIGPWIHGIGKARKPAPDALGEIWLDHAMMENTCLNKYCHFLKQAEKQA